MVKVTWLLLVCLVSMPASQSFEEACLKCHQDQELPDQMIYKRYLLKYSSPKRIAEAMVDYLKNPTDKKTIMPPQFINIFGLKEASMLSDTELNRHVDTFIDRYDLKKKLTLPSVNPKH